jgi:hypothetical protein
MPKLLFQTAKAADSVRTSAYTAGTQKVEGNEEHRMLLPVLCYHGRGFEPASGHRRQRWPARRHGGLEPADEAEEQRPSDHGCSTAAGSRGSGHRPRDGRLLPRST